MFTEENIDGEKYLSRQVGKTSSHLTLSVLVEKI